MGVSLSSTQPTGSAVGVVMTTGLPRYVMNPRTPRAELAYLCSRLNDEEIVPLIYLARRLEAGRVVYGSFEKATDKRVMLEELRAELADGLFYLTIELESHQ